jgi:hypothetical protein
VGFLGRVFIAVVAFYSGCSAQVVGSTADLSNQSDGLSNSVHRMFTTQAKYAANFGSPNQADLLCKAQAQAAGLTRDYRAIVGNSEQRPFDRFQSQAAVKIYSASLGFLDLAPSLIDVLNGGNLDRAPWFDQYGATYSSFDTCVWTGFDPVNTCSDWSSTSLAESGSGGDSWYPGSWLESCPSACSVLRRFYCISPALVDGDWVY